MKRIILIVLKLILSVPGYFSKLNQYIRAGATPAEVYPFLRKFDHDVIKAARVTILSEGEENIPKEGGFIFYPNHQGLFDTLAMVATCERPFSFVYKKELQNTILIGKVFKSMGAIPIDRSSLKQSFGVINEMADRVEKGNGFVIYAEGTRSRMGNKLLPFKGGSFKAATMAKCPIVPVALVDCFKPFDNDSIKPETVKVIYLKPIPYEEYSSMKTPEIAAMVRSRIEDEIAKNI